MIRSCSNRVEPLNPQISETLCSHWPSNLYTSSSLPLSLVLILALGLFTTGGSYGLFLGFPLVLTTRVRSNRFRVVQGFGSGLLVFCFVTHRA